MLWTPSNFSQLKFLRPTLMDMEKRLSGKSNFIRTAVLYEFGGIYIDADSQWVNRRCLDDVLLMASNTGFLGAQEPGRGFAASTILASVKHHPLVRALGEVQASRMIAGLPTANTKLLSASWQKTGPVAVSLAMALADNYKTNRFCGGQDHQHQFLLQSYYAEPVSATESMLATLLHGRYFYPANWHGLDPGFASNISAIEQIANQNYSYAVMFHTGFTTNKVLRIAAKYGWEAVQD